MYELVKDVSFFSIFGYSILFTDFIFSLYCCKKLERGFKKKKRIKMSCKRKKLPHKDTETPPPPALSATKCKMGVLKLSQERVGGVTDKNLSLSVCNFRFLTFSRFDKWKKGNLPLLLAKKSPPLRLRCRSGGRPPPQRLTPCSNSMLNLLEWGETVVGCITGAGGEKKGGGAEKNPSSLRRRRRPCLPRNATTPPPPPPPFCGWAAECNRGLGGGGKTDTTL